MKKLDGGQLKTHLYCNYKIRHRQKLVYRTIQKSISECCSKESLYQVYVRILLQNKVVITHSPLVAQNYNRHHAFLPCCPITPLQVALIVPFPRALKSSKQTLMKWLFPKQPHFLQKVSCCDFILGVNTTVRHTEIARCNLSLITQTHWYPVNGTLRHVKTHE